MPAPIMPAPRMPTLRRLPLRRRPSGRDCAGLDRVQVEEERGDHVLRDLADHELGEVAALDAHARCRSRPARLRPSPPGSPSGAGYRPRVFCVSIAGATVSTCGDLRAGRRAAGHLVVLASSQGCFGAGLAAIQAQRLRAAGPPSFAAEPVHQAELRAPRAGRTACLRRGRAARPCRPSRRIVLVTPLAPGSRPSVTSGRPNWIFGSSSAMRQCADQRHLPAAAQRRAVEQRDHRLAQRLERAEAASSSPSIPCEAPRPRRPASSCSTSFRSAPAKKVFLAEARMHALDARPCRVDQRARRRRRRSSCQCLGHGVDRRAGRVEGERDDAVGVEFVADRCS